jgi:hypothetical protein
MIALDLTIKRRRWLFGETVKTNNYPAIQIDVPQLGEADPPLFDQSIFRRISHKLDGDRRADVEPPTTQRPYRFVKPARLTEVYERTSAHRLFEVIRRRGFAQYALTEFPDRSVGVFVHRGESTGRAVRTYFFLGNRQRNHGAIFSISDKLACKLSDHALVISDGSNVRPKFLRKFHGTETSGSDAFSALRKRHFSYGNLDWICVGYVEKKNGPTLVWDVTRKNTRLHLDSRTIGTRGLPVLSAI